MKTSGAGGFSSDSSIGGRTSSSTYISSVIILKTRIVYNEIIAVHTIVISLHDLFIALKVREDVWVDDSELHLERDESFRDLFDLLQPRARAEDLVRIYGEKNNLIYSKLGGTDGSRNRKGMLDFASLAVSFSSRRVGIIITAQGRKRTVVDTERARDEALEAAAQRLIIGLGDWVHN